MNRAIFESNKIKISKLIRCKLLCVAEESEVLFTQKWHSMPCTVLSGRIGTSSVAWSYFSAHIRCVVVGDV